MTTFETVRKIIAKTLSKSEEEITMESHLVNDLGADSLDAVDIVMDLEDEFGVSIDDEAVTQIHTVGDLVAAVDANK